MAKKRKAGDTNRQRGESMLEYADQLESMVCAIELEAKLIDQRLRGAFERVARSVRAKVRSDREYAHAMIHMADVFDEVEVGEADKGCYNCAWSDPGDDTGRCTHVGERDCHVTGDPPVKHWRGR